MGVKRDAYYPLVAHVPPDRVVEPRDSNPDLLNAIQTRSQLRHGPTVKVLRLSLPRRARAHAARLTGRRLVYRPGRASVNSV